MMFLAGALVLSFRSARANDGFFWGAGDTLRPVNNRHLRVEREELVLGPVKKAVCYEVLFRGKPQLPPDEYDYATGEHEFATIGKVRECSSLAKAWARFSPSWTADAVYRIETFDDAADVQFGFPVHDWMADFIDSEGLDGVQAPGVSSFKTFIDGEEILPLALKWLDGFGVSTRTITLGYVWKASFRKGRKHVLRTSYEFGVYDSGSFYVGREYPVGEKPWFVDKTWFQKGGTPWAAKRLIYYLTPLNQWALPPPSEIAIKVELPAGLSPLFVVPLETKPSCVDERGLFFHFKDKFPDRELEISYPAGRSFNKPLESSGDLEAWFKTVGPRADLSCALLSRLKKESSPAVQELLKFRACRKKC
ncbi:MAG: hypothetical protein HY921_06365 [Elusimicrobia bacterium]|nr:hypothetical protein [Elusimicrobiota bacterium]